MAYYKENIRASRFVDLMERYKLSNIINEAAELNGKAIKNLQPREETYTISESIIKTSVDFIKNALS